jgi:hypothetical protein
MASVGSSRSGRNETREFTVSALFGWATTKPLLAGSRPLFILNTSLNRTRRIVVSSRSVTGSSSKRRGMADR